MRCMFAKLYSDGTGIFFSNSICFNASGTNLLSRPARELEHLVHNLEASGHLQSRVRIAEVDDFRE